MYVSKEQVDEYLRKYNHHLSKEDIQKCAAQTDSLRALEYFVTSLYSRRERESQDGVRHVQTQPLIHVLSAEVRSKKDGQLSIYGEIYADYYCDKGYWVKHQLFKCEKDAPQIVGTNRILPLKGPDFLCDIRYGCIPLRKVRLVVKLFDQTGEKIEDRFFTLPTNKLIDYDGFERLGSMVGDTITLRYIIIPHGISCRMKIRVFPTHSADSLFNVNGRIVVKYANTYSYPFSEECVLFDKQGHESEQVNIGTGELNLSRCWLALSAYSALVVDVDLSIIGTDKKIVGTAKMFPENGGVSGDTIVVDDYMVNLDAAWVRPKFFRLPKFMKQKQPSPSPSPALEIFTVFVGFGQTMNPVARVHGSIELADGRKICSIFKKDDENALEIVSNWNSIPLLDGSRVLQDYLPLYMKVDVKDVDGSVAVKGYVGWEAQVLDTGAWHDKILCSIIRGQSGFVALYYAMFSEAVEAEIKVDLDLELFKMGPWHGGVEWSLTAEYSCFDYSSFDNRKYPRIVLAKEYRDDTSGSSRLWDGEVQLSRSKIVVPSHSSLVLRLRYTIARENLRDKYRHGLLGRRDRESLPVPSPFVQLVERICKIKIGEGFKRVEVCNRRLSSTAEIGIEWKKIT